MLDQDVDETVALKLTREVSQFLITNSPLYKKGFKQCLVHVLNENGIFASPVKIAREKQKLVAFIGSTGVGKTTTIAKLAAAAKTREEKKHVALITLDENRIGAIEQLKIYAKIIGVPLKAASSKTELKRYVEKLNKYDLIFIDTPGISQTNQDQLNELHDIFTRVHDVEFQLVLSAGTNDKTLSDVVKKYGVFNISRLMFTKLDEAITYGSILNQLYRSKIPVSYFTNGQQVPENIEAAKIEKLADLLFNEKDNKNYLIGSPEELARNIIEFENKLTGTDDESGTYSNENGFENARRYIVHPNVYGEKKFNSYRY
ncbi:MAG: 50S ribosome-binding GTPase [Deltaproteobacteria bacterium]|nr:50S ribosome-binding GTPase [Deltaproteobacteria bacterium]